MFACMGRPSCLLMDIAEERKNEIDWFAEIGEIFCQRYARGNRD